MNGRVTLRKMLINKRVIKIILCFFWVSVLSNPVQALGVFPMFKIYVFSRMEGVVLKDGKPVEGAVIRRSADHYNDRVYSDEAVSDAQGKFRLDAITTRSLRPLMFDTVVLQELHIHYGGEQYLGWKAFKKNNHHRGELSAEDEKSELPIRCTFDLDQDDSKEQTLRLDSIRNRVIHGLCQLN